MPTEAIEGFVVDPLRFEEKPTLYAIYSVLVSNPSRDWAWIDRPGCGTVRKASHPCLPRIHLELCV